MAGPCTPDLDVYKVSLCCKWLLSSSCVQLYASHGRQSAAGPTGPCSYGSELVIGARLCKRAVHVAQQAPCAPDWGFYGGSIVLRVDTFKPDASWLRLQAVQTVHPLVGISVQTSSEAVVCSPSFVHVQSSRQRLHGCS